MERLVSPNGSNPRVSLRALPKLLLLGAACRPRSFGGRDSRAANDFSGPIRCCVRLKRSRWLDLLNARVVGSSCEMKKPPCSSARAAQFLDASEAAR